MNSGQCQEMLVVNLIDDGQMKTAFCAWENAYFKVHHDSKENQKFVLQKIFMEMCSISLLAGFRGR